MNEDIQIIMNELVDLLDKRNLKFVICVDYGNDLSLIRQTRGDEKLETISKNAHDILFGDELNDLL